MRTPGEGSVYRTKDGRWRVVVTVGLTPEGKPLRKYLAGGSTKAQANARLRSAVRDRDEGVLTSGRDMTVADWLTFWVEDVVGPKRAPKTYAGYASLIKVWITPALGRHRLSKLAPEHIDALYRDMTGQGSKQVRHAHAILRRSLKIAVRYGRVGRNVAELVDPPTTDRPEVEPFTAKDAAAILTAAGEGRNAARWRVALSLGMRQGEALGLAWSDVDLDAGVLFVRQQLQRNTYRHGCKGTCGRSRGADCPRRLTGGLVLRQPKSKRSRRVITLPDTLTQELRAHRVEQLRERLAEGEDWAGFTWQGDPVDLVFAQRDGRPISPTTDRKVWVALLERAGVDYQRLHDARHTAATLLLVQGVDVKVVAEILGHSTTNLTRDTYQHVVPELRRAAADAMDAALVPGSSVGSRSKGHQRTSARGRRAGNGA